jgi:hypothetical protein
MAGGPAVEGFSNPLWVAYMALLHLLPLSAAKISLAVQLTGAALLLGCILMVRRVAAACSGGDPAVWLTAVILTGTYLPLQFWGLRGMEPPLLALLTLVVVSRLASRDGAGEGGEWIVFTTLGVGLLVRIDFAVIYFGVALFLMLTRPRRWRRIVLAAGVVAAVTVGGSTLARYLVYGELLPNPYFLKVSGIPWSFRAQRGASMAWAFIRTMSPVVFLLPFLFLALRPKQREGWLLGGLIVLQLGYSLHVGGDAWEWWGHGANRFVVVVMPLFFILTALALREVGARVERGVRRGHGGLRLTLLSAAVLVVVIQLHGGFRGALLRDLLRADGLYVREDEAQVRYALRLREVTRPEAKIAVAWAGAIPYFSGRGAIDLFGKNDARIARLEPVIRDASEVYPGHNKRDYAYSIGELEPDVVAHDYFDVAGHLDDYRAYAIADPRIVTEGSEVCYLREGAEAIRWEAVSEAAWLMGPGDGS